MAHKVQLFNPRQSMQNNKFEIFHYRDNKPENIGVHNHNFYELYFFLGGKVQFSVESSHYCMEKGDILLINPVELHQAQIDRGQIYERMVLWIDCQYLSELGGNSINLAECFDRKSPKHTNFIRPDNLQRAYLHSLLEKLNKEFYGNKEDSMFYAETLLTQFMIEINRLTSKSEDVPYLEKNQDLIAEVLNYIGNHFQENLTLEKLTSEFFVSKYYLSHEFKNRVGTSIYRYIMFRRLMQAREMLLAGVAPGDVCEACGFGDYANFYRAFKSEYNISPRDFLQSRK